MALDMTAAVKIQASVDGVAQIAGLEKSLQRVDKEATGLQGTFNRLKGITSGLGGAFGALLPAAGIAGLTALGKRAIDTADNLNDLSQRTGVGVESLSKFGAAAADSGSSVDEVAKAMGRLARGVVDPASKANEALRSIGVSSTDASGKIKSMDQIMLDVADRFAKMPDGAQKTALAMDLFGKSGANLIPMLNQGRDALGQYSATTDTHRAQAADKFHDSINAVARAVAGPFNQAITALLPLITQVAQGIASFAQWFSGLPGPVQAAIAGIAALTAGLIALAPAISALITIGGALGAVFAGGGIFATLAGTLGAVVPVITAIGTALSGLLPILVAVFTGPAGWVALLVAAGVAIYAFRDQIAGAFQAIGQVITGAATAFTSTFITPVQTGFQMLVNGIKTAFASLGSVLTAPFQAAATTIKGIVNGILNGIGSAISSVVNAINGIIAGANQALAALKLPQIPRLPSPSIPRFADGGVVSGPTLAMVGEGGEPEYIVPQSKATGFANNWLAGMRGGKAIPKFAEGGVVMPSSANVSIQTGPVTQMDGTNFVTTQDLSRAVQAGVDQTLALLAGDINVRAGLGLI
jgi:phage-related protein